MNPLSEKTTQDTPMQQLSAADVMLMQAQGKEIPNREPVQANVQQTPEIDTVISSVVAARKNQSSAMGHQNKNLVAQVLKIYAVVNAVAGILALTLFDRMGVLAIVLALASIAAGFGIYAAGEAIQLLQNISSNTAKGAKLLEQKKI